MCSKERNAQFCYFFLTVGHIFKKIKTWMEQQYIEKINLGLP